MKNNLSFVFLMLVFTACTSGSLTDQFFGNLSKNQGVVTLEATHHLEDGSAGEITPEGYKVFSNDLGYQIELSDADLYFQELNLLSTGDDPLCQGGFDQSLPVDEAHSLLDEDMVGTHMGSFAVPMVFFCQFEWVLGDAATEAFHFVGTWSKDGESGTFDLMGHAPIFITGVFQAEENGEVIVHPLHFHEGETEVEVMFSTEYDALFSGMDFKTQDNDGQLDTIYKNFPHAIHQDVSGHDH